MPELLTLPFAQRFTARLNSGTAASRPGTPSGVGDAYYATDTNVLSLANAAGSGWDTYDLSDLGTLGDYLLRDGSQPMTGALNMGQNYINVQQLGAAPSNPSANNWRLYFLSGGLYYRDSAGVETGPLGTGGGGGGGGVDSGVRLSGAENPLTADDTMTDGSGSTLEFTSEDVDTDAYADLGSDPTIVTIPTNGYYEAIATLTVSNSGGTPNGPVFLSFGGTASMSGGATVHMTADSLGTSRRQSAVGARNLNAGQTLSVSLSNECGETITFSVVLSVHRLGDQLA